MIHPLVKLITIDGFFNQEEAIHLANVTRDLQFKKVEFGEEVENFNMVSPDIDEMFSGILGSKIEVDKEQSGVFRRPDFLIHFESFTELNEWIFVVALEQSTFNVYEHQTGISSALQEYKFGYRNLFEWDLQINYVLKPGQGILFRPWLFHSFDKGLIQLFKLKELL